MKAEKIIGIIFTVLFVALAVFLALVLFIKPDFLEPITSWVHGFGVFSIGGISFSIGGTIALLLFFGLMASEFRRKK